MTELTSQLWVQVKGARLNVKVAGKGPALLLVHGFPDTQQVWRNQIPALVKAGFQVIVPDTRGCGESSMPVRTKDYKINALTDDLRCILDELKIELVGLVGHDWGAVIAWHFLMAHPERVNRFVALSVGHPLAYATDGLMQKIRGWYAVLFQFKGLAELLLTAFDWSLFRSITGKHGECHHWITGMKRPARLTAALNYYRANLWSILAQRTYPPVLRPVMGVWSDGDKFLTERQMLRSQKWVKAQWEYRRIEGVSHWLQLDAPDEINALLINYFKNINNEK